MTYYEKYLKYKAKYLQLLAQIGGNNIEVRQRDGNSTNCLSITNLPKGTTREYLLGYLTSSIPELEYLSNEESTKFKKGKAGETLQTFYLCFKDSGEAGKNVGNIQKFMATFKLGGNYHLIPPRVSRHASAAPSIKIAKPWGANEQLLFIALVISQNSALGRVIDGITKKVLGGTAYKNKLNDGKLLANQKLLSPHITLLSINIRPDSVIDKTLLEGNFQLLSTCLKCAVEDNLMFNNINFAPQLHSVDGQYKKLGNWIAIMFDDMSYYNKDVFTKCKNDILNYVTFPNKLTSGPKMKPAIQGTNATTFTHYTNTSNNSEMAISEFYSDEWMPHISLDRSDHFDKFSESQAPDEMSWVNLWSSQLSKTGKNVSGGQPGSISHLYVSYKDKSFFIPF